MGEPLGNPLGFRTDGPYGRSVRTVRFSSVFSIVFGVFDGVAGHPAQIRPTRRTPQGGIQGSSLPLEEPSSETLLGKNLMNTVGTPVENTGKP